MDILNEDLEIDSPPPKHEAGKGPMTAPGSSSSNPPLRCSMRDVTLEGERSEEESTSVSIEESEADAEDGPSSSSSEDDSDIHDEETVDSHRYDLETYFLQKGHNGEGSPLESEINFILPTPDDKAYHHRRGTCLYWVLPYCGLRLSPTKFECTLLQILDVAPCQLTPSTWCHVSSFQQLFEKILELINFESTLPIFEAFYNLYYTSSEHLALRQTKG